MSGSHPFASQLAPVYGALDSGACKDMDHELEVMVEATTQLLRAPAYHKLAWSTLSDQMMQNSLIEPIGDERCSTKALVEDAGSSFRFQDVQEPSTRHEVLFIFHITLDTNLMSSCRSTAILSTLLGIAML